MKIDPYYQQRRYSYSCVHPPAQLIIAASQYGLFATVTLSQW